MRILVVPNTLNHVAVQAGRELVEWCLANSLDPVLEQSDASHCGLDAHGVSAAELGDIALAVALGGDGTILKAVHLIGEVEVPLLGVKYGRLGFLSGARPEGMFAAVRAALDGSAGIERRTTLSIEVTMQGRIVGRYRALNEVAVARGTSGRVVAMDYSIDGHRVMSTRADALVVATATGSTAYALSAGGPIVAPGFAGMVVVAVAPHTLAARSIVTNPESTVEVTLPDPTRSDACLVIDGDVRPCRQTIERVAVSRGGTDVLLVKLGGHDFYETVAAEFFGGAHQ